MTQNLLEYLAQNPIDDMEQEVHIDGRLSKFKFRIKPMTSDQFYKYQRISTIAVQGKTKEVKFNAGRFNELVILNHVVEPNFKDSTLLSSAGVNTPEQYLNKYFLAGELAKLSDKISEISGFETTDEELEEEAKNS